MNCHVDIISNLNKKSQFCPLDDFFTNFDQLTENVLDLDSHKFIGTVLNVTNNINPAFNAKHSEIHTLRLVLKTPIPDHPTYFRYYAIGFPLVVDDKQTHFVLHDYPHMYCFTVKGKESITLSTKPIKGTFTSFNKIIPHYLHTDCVEVIPSYLNTNDGDFIQTIFRYVDKNPNQIKQDASHTLAFLNNDLMKGIPAYKQDVANLVNSLFKSYKFESNFSRPLLHAIINKEIHDLFQDLSSTQTPRKIFNEWSKDLFFLHYFDYFLHSYEYMPVDQHSDDDFCECNPCSFRRMIEFSSFQSEINKIIDHLLSSPTTQESRVLKSFIQHPNDLNKNQLLDYINSRFKHRSESTLSITTPSQHTIPTERFARGLLELINQRIAVTTPEMDFLTVISDNEPHDFTQEDDMNTFAQQLHGNDEIFEFIGTTQTFSTEEKSVKKEDQIQTLEHKANTQHPALADIATANIIHPDSDTLEMQSAEDQSELVDVIADKSPKIDAVEKAVSIYSQQTFNPLDNLLKENLPLIPVILGTKKLDKVSVDDLGIYPFFLKTYDPKTTRYSIQTHIISFIYKEYFTKDMSENGMINYLGFGHEIIFDGSEFSYSKTMNVYAIHQRKGKIVSVALSDYLEFSFEKPAIIPLNDKNISPQFDCKSASSKNLLDYATSNRLPLEESTHILCNMINQSFQSYLTEHNLNTGNNSALRFICFTTKELESIGFSSVSNVSQEDQIDTEQMNNASVIEQPLEQPAINPPPVIKDFVEKDGALVHTSLTETLDGSKLTIYVDPVIDKDLESIVIAGINQTELPEINFIHTKPPASVMADSLAYTTAQPPTTPIEKVADATIEAVISAESAPISDSCKVTVEEASVVEEVSIDANTDATVSDIKSSSWQSESLPFVPESTEQIFFNSILRHLPKRADADTRYWHFETDLGYVLNIELSKHQITFSVVDSNQLDVHFDLDNFLAKQDHYYLFSMMTNKKTAKSVRKFVKMICQQDLFNRFKSA